jgi:predicted glycosyltransferase
MQPHFFDAQLCSNIGKKKAARSTIIIFCCLRMFVSIKVRDSLFLFCFIFVNILFSYLQSHPRILISPLDWGLGHTSRCVPIIAQLQQKGASVVIAANHSQIAFLKAENITAEYVQLDGYNVQYATTKLGFMVKIATQIPKIIRAIKAEHSWLQQFIDEHKIDAVISDNRYGLHSTKIPCVFITHQLNIQAPFFRSWINAINHKYIQKFSTCWVPDAPQKNSIAGALSVVPMQLMKHVQTIGLLSRFQKQTKQVVPKPNSILCILSGVEPQKSMLKTMIEKEFQQLPFNEFTLTIVGNHLPITSDNSAIKFITTAPKNQLQELIDTHHYIISRSGYSTIMDLAALQRQAILIPTPGQTEQEYLATYLAEKKWHYTTKQHRFNLQKCLTDFDQMQFVHTPLNDEHLLENAIDALFNSIPKKINLHS